MNDRYENEITRLKQELEGSKQIIQDLKHKSSELQKAIWDMINYANMYVLLLDKNMIVKLINWSLANELGFENEKQVIGKCWLDFIPNDYKELIEIAHFCLIKEKKYHKYKEMANEVKKLDGTTFLVKWFNIPINNIYNITFSIGLKANIEESNIVSEDSIRSYYRDIIVKDRTMIQSLKDISLKGFEASSCKE